MQVKKHQRIFLKSLQALVWNKVIPAQKRRQEFEAMGRFKKALCNNNLYSRAKRKGLPPAIHRQQALAAAS